MKLPKRFKDKTQKQDSCVIWTAQIDRDGYGRFWFEGKLWRSHRFAFFAKHGTLPEVVMHTCDNPKCVNVNHLKAGTQLDNQRDKKRKKRSARGTENGGGGKLTETMVREIKRRLKAGESQLKIAEDFPCSRSTVCAIKLNRLWSWIK